MGSVKLFQGQKIKVKLDGVGPLITDPPPISSTNLSGKKEEKNVTCDT